MSIATDLQANLSKAKAAVVTKGGTVGETGLNGLEEEILSIPSGPDIPDLPDPENNEIYYFFIGDKSGLTIPYRE